MKNKPELIVLDTCVYVDALFIGHAQHADASADRAQRSLRVLESLDKGEYIAGLLPLVLIELNSSRQLGQNSTSKQRKARKVALDQYFNGFGHITLEHDERVALLGAKIAREMQMKGPDAMLVASAVVHDAAILYSWDDKVLSLNANPLVRSLYIQKPPERVAPAQATIYELLDAKYQDTANRILKHTRGSEGS
ncbi:putative nucleic acid-binding protein [Arthrobacter sp. JUb119]|nr:putative nucleic acid-binding protein [Arthrobacter sp. JUb119]